MNAVIAAYEANKPAAHEALQLFKAMAPNSSRVPGCDTAIRLGYRISLGRSVEEAAAREYVYRWHLAVDGMLAHGDGTASWAAAEFAPHALGM